MTIPKTMLIGPGLPEEAFALEVSNFFNQVPETDTVPMKKIDLARSAATITFMQELASKQDELLVSAIKMINAIKVEEVIDGAGAPAWPAVQESVARDYGNIVEFCQAGLDKLLEDYPMEGEEDADTSTRGSGSTVL